jgi:hypothetical protein
MANAVGGVSLNSTSAVSEAASDAGEVVSSIRDANLSMYSNLTKLPKITI